LAQALIVFIVLIVGPPLIGFLTRRWVAVVVPLVAWPLYYVGLNRHWWGVNGTGDGWQSLAVLLAIVGALGTGAAVVAGQRLAGRFSGAGS
jgi:hypothetical protein